MPVSDPHPKALARLGPRLERDEFGLNRRGLNEAATAARTSRFCEGLLPERMWMLKPIPQTGVTDGRVEPSSSPHD